MVGDSMNTTCFDVTATSCCQVARSSSTACALASAPLGVPFTDAQPDVLRLVTEQVEGRLRRLRARPAVSTANSTRLPSAATRGTCDAIGTVSPPANSSGSRRREYREGRPVSGNASTDPACQKTPASASDSLQRYDTATPSRSSTAWSAAQAFLRTTVASGPSAPPGASPPARSVRRPPRRTAAPTASGPIRSSVPCRSGGSAPSMGSDACSIPITTAAPLPRRRGAHSPGQPGRTPDLGRSMCPPDSPCAR